MSKIVKKVARDVAADLLGEMPKKVTKASVLAKVKAAKSPAERKAAAKKPVAKKPVAKKSNIRSFEDSAKIKVLGEFEGRGKNEKVYALIRSAKTLGAYRTAREKKGLKGLGGILGSLIKAGKVSVTA